MAVKLRANSWWLTRDGGRTVHIMSEDNGRFRSVTGILYSSDGHWMSHRRDEKSCDLVEEVQPPVPVPKPVEHDVYINIYRGFGGIHRPGILSTSLEDSKKAADQTDDTLIARLHLRFTEGQFDE
jgi:hypothetical protein